MNIWQTFIALASVALTVSTVATSAFAVTNVFTINVIGESGASIYGERYDDKLPPNQKVLAPIQSTVAPINATSPTQRKPWYGKKSPNQTPGVGDLVILNQVKFKAGKTNTMVAYSQRETKEAYLVPDSEWVVLDARVLGKTITGTGKHESKKLDTDGKFFGMTVKVKNMTLSEGCMDMVLFGIKDDKGREFHINRDSWAFAPTNIAEVSSYVPAGMTRTFYAVYEMPEDAKGLLFEARTFTTYKIKSSDLTLYRQPIRLDQSTEVRGK